MIKQTTVLLAAAVWGSSAMADHTINYSGPSYSPYTGDVEGVLTLNVDGDSTGEIVVAEGGVLDNPDNQALLVNYNSGVAHYYLAGIGASGTVNGHLDVNIEGGSFNDQTSSSEITAALLGTSYGESSAVIDGNVSVNITNGDFHGSVFAGGGASVTGNLNLTIAGGTFHAGGVFGGNAWGGETQGSATTRITGGDFTAVDVYGGSDHTNPEQHSPSRIGGDVALFIEGGSFRHIYGGSVNGQHDRDPGLIEGDVTIVIDSSAAPVSISGDIYISSGAVDGAAALIFNGAGDDLNFTGKVQASSATNSDEGSLGEFATVQFGDGVDDYKGIFNGHIAADVYGVAVMANSEVAFGEAFVVERLMVDATAQATLAVGTEFDYLTLVFMDRTFTEGEQFAFDFIDVFGASAGLVEGMLGDLDAFTLLDQQALEWSAEYANGILTAVGLSTIPEPSTYTVLLGLMVIGTLLRMRRKKS